MLADDGGRRGGDEHGGGRRPRAARRRLPLGRGATLIVGQRTHIVGLSDLSATGAYLVTGVSAAVGDELALHLIAVPGKSTLSARVRVVRVVREGVEKDHHPCGLAVEFVGLAPDDRQRIESYVRAGLRR
jgi:hypothetical protein